MTGTTKFRRPLAAALTLGVAITLAACSTPTPAPSEPGDAGTDGALRIGFSPFSMQIPAFIGLSEGLTAIAGGQGDTVITADAKNDPSTQLQQIQQWVELDQVDAIWVIPVAAETVTSAIQAALDKGIVVIASGVASDYGMEEGAPGITFTNIDNAAYGSALGDLTAQCVTEKFDGKGQVIYLQSPSGQQSTAESTEAFKGAVSSGAPDAVFVNEQTAADRLGSQQLVLTALQAAPDANTVVGTDDESSLGALDAFAQAGKSADDTCVIGAGGNDEAKAAVTDGKMYGLVAFDFGSDIGQNVGELHKLAGDPSAPGSVLTTPIQVITE